MNNLFVETLPTATSDLVKSIQKSKPKFLSDFYLSGGTALSLQIGHRESEDLDFFIQKDFEPEILQPKLTQFGKLEQTEIAKGTLNTFINNVQVQFLEYPYGLIGEFVDFNGIRLSSVIDIACTKLLTVSSRESKKDFIDIYFLLDLYSFEELFEALDKKYQGINYNIPHILKSLVYFETAESEPMPRMHKNVSWEEVKKRMQQNIKSYKF